MRFVLFLIARGKVKALDYLEQCKRAWILASSYPVHLLKKLPWRAMWAVHTEDFATYQALMNERDRKALRRTKWKNPLRGRPNMTGRTGLIPLPPREEPIVMQPVFDWDCAICGAVNRGDLIRCGWCSHERNWYESPVLPRQGFGSEALNRGFGRQWECNKCSHKNPDTAAICFQCHEDRGAWGEWPEAK